MAQSTPSEDRSTRLEDEFDSRRDPVGSGPDIDPVSPRVRPSFLVDLAATIESVVIPRLQLKHEIETRPNSGSGETSPIDDAMVRVFVDKLMKGESRDALRHVENLLERGHPMDTVLANLLGPAAQLMGEMWEQDSCSFVDVTLGMTRIQYLFRQLRTPFGTLGDASSSKGRALLLPAPGEQHIFGLKIVEDFLMRDGWEVDCRLHVSLSDVLSIIRDEAYDFVGFSMSGERLLEPLTSAIRLVRLNSRNRAIRIMAGGVYFADKPDAGREIDADAITTDARDAVMKANEWYATLRTAQ